MYRLTLVAAALAVATPALAAAPTANAQKGAYFSASWYSDTGDACAFSTVSVSVFEGVTRSGAGGPVSSTTAYAYVGNYNYCTGTFNYYYGTLDTVSLSVSPNAASLSGSGTLYDYYSGAALPVTVSATGDDSAGSSSGVNVLRQDSPTLRYFYRSTGTSAYGNATIDLNGTSYTSTTGASFGRSNSATLTVTE